MKQFISDVKNARKNRIALEKLQAAVRETSDLVNPQRPSLRIENYRYRNRRDLLLELLGPEFHPFGNFRNSKIGWRKVMDQLQVPGLDMPKLYGVYDSIHEIELENLPANFVIKPDAGLATLGVLALRKEPNDYFYNYFTGKFLTWPEILTHFDDVKSQNKIRLTSKLIVEEFLVDPATPERLPSDWKFFVGAGKVFLIYKVTRVPTDSEKGFENRFKFWNDELRPHPQIHADRIQDDTAQLPENIHQLIEIAINIGTSFAQPVGRVDLYNLPGRVVFGEYTPNPGGHYAAKKLQDETLGRAWLEAEVRYNAMLLKKLQELGYPKFGLAVWKP